MTVYLLNIALTAAIASFAVNPLGNRDMAIGYKKSVSKIALFLILILWTTIYAFRGENVGSDTWNYMYYYNQLGIKDISLQDYLSQGGDIIFETIRYVSNRLTGSNWVFFAAVVASITYLPVLLVVRHEGKNNFILSLLLYIFMLHFYYGFNAMRQMAAVSLSLYAYVIFFKNKKYKYYSIFMLIAFGLHSTAIFVIPFHFMSRFKLKSKTLWIIILALLGSAISFQSVWNSAITLFSLVGNDVLANRYSDNSFSGSSYIRVLVSVSPVVLGIWKYNLLKKNDKDVESLIILLIFNVIFMIFSTHNWLFARLASYLDIYSILFIPKLSIIFDRESRNVVVFAIGMLYFIYMTALILNGEAHLYPYYFL